MYAWSLHVLAVHSFYRMYIVLGSSLPLRLLQSCSTDTSGLASIAGMETPEAVELRKRTVDSAMEDTCVGSVCVCVCVVYLCFFFFCVCVCVCVFVVLCLSVQS